MKREVQKHLPIIPNQSLGGFELRTHLIDIQQEIALLGGTLWGNYGLIGPFEANYRMADGLIDIGVDVRNGKVVRITAHSGYKGKLLGKISIGMKAKKVTKLLPSLYFEERTYEFLSKEYPGLALNVGELDPPLDLLPEMEIKGIAVLASEFDTFAGYKGLW